jgi:hypothetical protein
MSDVHSTLPPSLEILTASELAQFLKVKPNSAAVLDAAYKAQAHVSIQLGLRFLGGTQGKTECLVSYCPDNRLATSPYVKYHQ